MFKIREDVPQILLDLAATLHNPSISPNIRKNYRETFANIAEFAQLNIEKYDIEMAKVDKRTPKK